MAGKDSVTAEQIKKIAGLAKLQLTPETIETYTGQINAILQHVQTLESVDVEGVEPLSHVIDLFNVSAEDEPQPSLPRDKTLANAPRQTDDAKRPSTDGEYFVVPGMIKTGS